MAQYFTDFSEYTTGQQPSDWTRRVGDRTWEIVNDVTSSGGKALGTTVELETGRNVLSWDAIDADPQRADCEIFLRCKWPQMVEYSDCFAMTRGKFRTASDYDFYRIGVLPLGLYNTKQSNPYVEGEYSNGSIGGTGDSFEADTYYNIWIQQEGATQRLKFWKSGEPEPASWNGTGTDTNVSAEGSIGLFRASKQACIIDVFGVGTGTDPAPRGSSAATPPVLSNPLGATGSPTEFSGSVTTDSDEGTLYYKVTEAQSAPGVSEIKGANSQAVTKAGTQDVFGSGLVGGVTYYLHFYHEDSIGGSPVISTSSFTFDNFIKMPTNLAVETTTDTSVTLSWKAGV